MKNDEAQRSASRRSRRNTCGMDQSSSTPPVKQAPIPRQGQWSTNSQQFQELPVTPSEIRLLLSLLRAEISDILTHKGEVDETVSKYQR